MAEDRTLLAFISGGNVGAGISRLRTSLEDQFVNSALIRTRLASGICFSNHWKRREKESEKEKVRVRERERERERKREGMQQI